MGDLGTFVRARRQELGLNLDQCATKAGITLQALSSIELGKTQSLKALTAYKLARALDVDVTEFLSRLEAVPA